MNPLRQITQEGQSIWLDYTKRSFVSSGELRRLIDGDGVSGVTSNPTIFGEAISRGTEYDDAIRAAAAHGRTADEAYDEIVVTDIQAVADELFDVFERTRWHDGYVSVEVSPHLAHDTAGSIAEAHQLWARIQRSNLFIKIPATDEGLPAIRRLIADGINVNITLIFGLPRYRQVAEAFIGGLEDRTGRGEPIDRVMSVASFFLSRIDLLVDSQLAALAQRHPDLAARTRGFQGRAAIACAKEAYQIYKEIFGSERFRRLGPARARTQRVLWASTSTKDPQERDVKYVEALIGRDTINTLPRQTLEAFRDHGNPTPRLEHNLPESRSVLRELGEIGIDLQSVSRQLEEEGIRKFIQPFDAVHAELARKLPQLATR